MKRIFGALAMAVVYFLGFVGIQFVVAFILAIGIFLRLLLTNLASLESLDLAGMLTEAILNESLMVSLISNGVILLTLFIIFLACRKCLARHAHLRAIPLRSHLLPAFTAIPLYLSVTFILSILPIANTYMDQYEHISGYMFSESLVFQLIAIALVAPVAEELVFRGLIFSRLRQAMPTPVAAVISSILFGLGHATPIWMAYAFLLGLVLCWICYRRGSVTASIAVHIVFNLLGVLSSQFSILDSLSGLAAFVILAAGVVASILCLAYMGKGQTPLKR